MDSCCCGRMLDGGVCGGGQFGFRRVSGGGRRGTGKTSCHGEAGRAAGAHTAASARAGARAGACTGARSGARAGADTRACAGRDPCTGSGK